MIYEYPVEFTSDDWPETYSGRICARSRSEALTKLVDAATFWSIPDGWNVEAATASIPEVSGVDY